MISINRSLYGRVIYLRILQSPRHKHVRRYVVRASHKDWYPVELEIERTSLAVQVRFLDPFDGSNTIAHGFFVQDLIIQRIFTIEVDLNDEDAEGVERLLT
jgi:hypothetical protein